MTERNRQLERILWSVAIPGLGQLLNGKIIKGILLIPLEFLINVYSHLNIVIMFSFQGRILDATKAANYQWLMFFYPCVYMYAIWNAYKDAGGGSTRRHSYLPFVLPAYLGRSGSFMVKRYLGPCGCRCFSPSLAQPLAYC